MSDLIDRHEAIRDIRLMDVCVIYDDMCSTEEAVEKAIVATKRTAIFGLECMPSAEPRKKGKWIERDDCWDGIYYECSVCKYSFSSMEGTPSDNDYYFCPSCGSYNRADMREGEEE